MAKTIIRKQQGGVIPGGATDEVLTKASGSNYDLVWGAGGSGFGGGSGGTLIDSDLTQKAVVGNTGTVTQSYTISIPGGSIGTKGAIRWSLVFNSFSLTGGSNNLIVSATYGGVSVGSATLSSPGGPNAGPYLSAEGMFIAANSDANQKGIVKINANLTQDISKNNSTGALATGYAASSVDSTVDQDLVVTFSVSNAIGNGATAQGIIVEKISSGNSSGQIERVSNINTTADLSIDQPGYKVFFIGIYMLHYTLGSGYKVFVRDSNTQQWVLETTVGGFTGLPVGYGSSPELTTDGTILYGVVSAIADSGNLAYCQIDILTGAVTDTSLVDDTVAPAALQNFFIDSGKAYAQLGISPFTWYEATYTPGGSTVGSASAFGTGFVPTIANFVLSSNAGFLYLRTNGLLNKIEIATNTLTFFSFPFASVNGASVDGALLNVATLMSRVVNPSGGVTRSQDLEIYKITNA